MNLLGVTFGDEAWIFSPDGSETSGEVRGEYLVVFRTLNDLGDASWHCFHAPSKEKLVRKISDSSLYGSCGELEDILGNF